MITKGIIEEVINENEIRVRIPVYNKFKENSGSTPTKNLSIATVCSPAGMKSIYTAGDIVYVSFEDNDTDNPIILGLLQKNGELLSTADLNIDSLKVKINCELPSETIIAGKNDAYTSIINTSSRNASNINSDMQQQLLVIQQRLKVLEARFAYPVGSIYMTSIDLTPEEMLFDGVWVKAADTFFIQFEDASVPVYIWKRQS